MSQGYVIQANRGNKIVKLGCGGGVLIWTLDDAKVLKFHRGIDAVKMGNVIDSYIDEDVDNIAVSGVDK